MERTDKNYRLVFVSGALVRAGLGLMIVWTLLAVPAMEAQTTPALRSVTLSWDPNPDTAAAGFLVYYGLASGSYAWTTNVGYRTAATIGGLLEGTTYYLAVTSYDADGIESDFSNEISYTPEFDRTTPPSVALSPAIAWSAPESIVYGTALGAAQLNATATCDGTNVPGTFTYAPAAGTVLDSGGSRVLTVQFTPADTGLFASASSAVFISVGKAPLTILANNALRSYGDSNPAFTGAISGVQNGDVITVAYSCGATPASPVGAYPIAPSLSGATLSNYVVALHDGTLTVGKAALTVTASDASRPYGDPNPSFTGIVAGVKNGDAITATYSCGATPASPAGSYAITPSPAGPALANYSVTLNAGTLTVAKAALTLTASDASRAYGDPNPTFTGTIAGLKNSDTVTTTYRCGATPASPVGSYAITPSPSGTALANYDVVLKNGTLTVAKTALAVTASNASRPYGDPNPSFTGIVAGVKNSDTVTATYSCGATPASPAGSYAITPSLSGAALANYDVVLNNGALTVGKAALTVTASNASRVYGDSNPSLTGTIAGVKNGDAITATYSCGATPTSPVGAYAITPALSSAILSNYVVTLNNGTLAVGKAALSVTALDASRSVGQTNPTFAGTITGVMNNDVVTAAYSCSATKFSPAGTYPIVPTVGGTALSNYSPTLNNGTLTITRRNSKSTDDVTKRESSVASHSLAIQNLGNGKLRLAFSGVPGRTYTAQYSDSAANPIWQDLGTFVASSDGINEYVDAPPAAQRMRVYRSWLQP